LKGFTHDGETSPSSSTIDGTFALAAQTSEGVDYGTAWDDLSTLTSKYVRFGVRTKNTAMTPTVPEFALVCIRVEFKKS
jgi:hypothetical protein